MKIKALLVAFLIVVVSAEVIGNFCTCSELTTSADCNYDAQTCTWSNNQCADYNSNTTTNTTTTVCSSFQYTSDCNAVDNCAWNTAGVCANFTKCADYQQSLDNAEYCLSIDSSCTVGAIGTDNVTCTEGSLDCTQIQDKTVCQSGLKLSTYEKCVWLANSTQQCQNLDYSQCETISTQYYCEDYNCIWENQECKAPYCSYYKVQKDCYNRRGNDYQKSKTLCDWVNNTCTDMDTSTLTAENCYKNTSRTYHWGGSSCNSCAGSYSYMLVFLGTLIFMMN